MGAHDKETEPPTANEAKSAEKQKKKVGKLRKTEENSVGKAVVCLGVKQCKKICTTVHGSGV